MTIKISHILTAVCVLLIVPSVLWAQEGGGTAGLRCRRLATNLNLYKRVLAAQIRSSIDAELYENIKVNVTFRLTRRENSSQTASFSDILNGLTVSGQGLNYKLEGSLAYALPCTYTYVASVKVEAIELETGARLSGLSESVVTLTSSGEVSIRNITPPSAPPATGEPEATAVPTSIPDEDDA